MKSAKLKIIWKEAGGGSASSEDKKWKQIEIDEIVEHYGAADILNNLLDGNSLLPLIDDHSILSSLDIDDEDVFFNFFNGIFGSKESIPKGLEMVLCILRNGLPPNDADDEFNDLEESELYLNETDQELEEYSPLVRILIEQLEILLQLITNDSLHEKVRLSNGKEMGIFGMSRLRVVEILICLIDEESSLLINEKLVVCNAFQIMLELLPKYPLHTTLHKLVTSFIRLGLRSQSVLPHLFNDVRLLDFLIDQCESEWKKPFTLRAGYSGFLAFMVDAVLKMEFNDIVSEATSNHPRWHKFIDSLYSNYQDQNVTFNIDE